MNVWYKLQSPAKILSSSPVIGQHDRKTIEESQSKYFQDAPPLVPTLTSSKYHIKWKQLADLPAAMYGTYVAVQDRKVYVSGGDSPFKDAQNQVFVYDTDNDRWGQLPTPDHFFAIPQIIGGKLTLIGGVLIATNKVTNKVSTFDHTKQSWVSYYPDLLSVRSLPGVVTHMEYVIVAGGIKKGTVLLEDIEILDWVENSQWKRISIHLPVPMCALELTTYDNHLFVVGYINANLNYDKHVYKLPVALVTNSAHQLHCASTGWVELTQTTHQCSSLVTGLSSLIVVGGLDVMFTTETADIMMYDEITETWKKIDSLSFARVKAATTAINDNALIVIGGLTSMSDTDSASLTVVELGQVEKV